MEEDNAGKTLQIKTLQSKTLQIGRLPTGTAERRGHMNMGWEKVSLPEKSKVQCKVHRTQRHVKKGIAAGILLCAVLAAGSTVYAKTFTEGNPSAGSTVPGEGWKTGWLQPIKIVTSSELYEYGYDHNGWNVDDWNFTTCWAEGASNNGLGEYIDFYYPEGTIITGGVIFPGYLKSEDLFYKNGAPALLEVYGYPETGLIETSDIVNSFSACQKGCYFTFDQPIYYDNSKFRVMIEGMREGNTYADACITELFFYGVTPADSTPPSPNTAPVQKTWFGFDQAYASSTLIEQGADNSPGRLIDDDTTTAWQEGAEGDGVGETVTLVLPKGSIITGGVIYPGFLRNQSLFEKNGAPSKVQIQIGGRAGTLSFEAAATSFEKCQAGLSFSFDQPMISDGSIVLTIKGVRAGTTYQDTCISEVGFCGYGGLNYFVPEIPYIDPTPGY